MRRAIRDVRLRIIRFLLGDARAGGDARTTAGLHPIEHKSLAGDPGLRPIEHKSLAGDPGVETGATIFRGRIYLKIAIL